MVGPLPERNVRSCRPAILQPPNCHLAYIRLRPMSFDPAVLQLRNNPSAQESKKQPYSEWEDSDDEMDVPCKHSCFQTEAALELQYYHIYVYYIYIYICLCMGGGQDYGPLLGPPNIHANKGP